MPFGVDSASTETTSRSRTTARGMIIAAMNERGDGIRRHPAGREDHDRGDDDDGRADEVAQHFEVSAAHVDAAPLRRAQQPHRDPVRHEPDDRDDEHEPACDVDGAGIEQPLDALHRDPHRQHDQDDPVRQRPEHLGPLIAEGAAIVGGPRRDDARHQRDHEGCGIREHVRRIREQGERSRQDAPTTCTTMTTVVIASEIASSRRLLAPRIPAGAWSCMGPG